MIKIDEQAYYVPVLKMSRKVDVIDKYAQRTDSGDLQREILGVYFNYSLEFGFPNNSPYEYQRLWDKLTEPEEFHSLTLYDEKGEYTYTGYISGVQDEIIHIDLNGGIIKCSGLKCNMTSKKPSRVKI